MEDINKWLEETQGRCARLSEGYRLELEQLWWANLTFVVAPAVASTAAAIIAAIPAGRLGSLFQGWFLPPASILAGLAAILVTVHKALKCDEFQAECIRLAQEFQTIAEMAAVALARPAEERLDAQASIGKELCLLVKNARARLPTRMWKRADKRFKDSVLPWLPVRAP
jgi:hypothetical protein